jgi:hypothetical protein
MKIILENGTELFPISATGAKRTVQGANRDVLSFIFPADTSMDELDSLFTATNCEAIKIVNGDKEYVHNAYTIRTELKREPVEVKPATATEAAMYENRVIVSMGQRTYMETQLAETQAAMTALLTGEG